MIYISRNNEVPIGAYTSLEYAQEKSNDVISVEIDIDEKEIYYAVVAFENVSYSDDELNVQTILIEPTIDVSLSKTLSKLHEDTRIQHASNCQIDKLYILEIDKENFSNENKAVYTSDDIAETRNYRNDPLVKMMWLALSKEKECIDIEKMSFDSIFSFIKDFPVGESYLMRKWLAKELGRRGKVGERLFVAIENSAKDQLARFNIGTIVYCAFSDIESFEALPDELKKKIDIIECNVGFLLDKFADQPEYGVVFNPVFNASNLSYIDKETMDRAWVYFHMQ